MFNPIFGRMAVVTALFALAACSSAPRAADPRLSQPLPPPGAVTPGGGQAIQPQRLAAPGLQRPGGVPQDIVLRGVAFAESGDGRFPPESVLTVRVYDAAGAGINDPEIEQRFIRSGVLPLPYSINFRSEALAGVRQPTLAAQLEGPDGQIIYRSASAVPLVPGGSEDIPMVPVGLASANAGAPPAPAGIDPFTGAPIQRRPSSQYGIPDIRDGFGAPTFDSPIHPGQSYDPISISGPPTNGVF